MVHGHGRAGACARIDRYGLTHTCVHTKMVTKFIELMELYVDIAVKDFATDDDAVANDDEQQQHDTAVLARRSLCLCVCICMYYVEQ